jgi:regulator of sirC expression with transglutaminase-like and TPR domain
VRDDSLREAFIHAATADEPGLARSALCFARIGYPNLDPAPYLARLDEMGGVARDLVAAASEGDDPRRARAAALTRYFYDDLGFVGDREHYEDPRNSLLNVVLDRRAGIPISLAVVLIEIGARAGVPLEGVNFPGHFLVRLPAEPGNARAGDILLDPFHDGAAVTQADCRQLLRRHVGEHATLGPGMLATASRRDMLLRMLLNLKRAYVRMRSFPQARLATELLLALDPGALNELRDRGLLAYHLEDFPSALRDLQSYLQLVAPPEDEDEQQELKQIWEHVKALKRRLASFN